MTKFLLSVFSALAMVYFWPEAASAQNKPIHPSCQKMDNKLGCTCALEIGGIIKGNGEWQYFKWQTPAYQQCMQKAGAFK